MESEEEFNKRFFKEGVAVRSIDEWGTHFFVRVTKDSIELYEPTEIHIQRKDLKSQRLEYLAFDLEYDHNSIKNTINSSFFYSSREKYRNYLKEKIQHTRNAATKLAHEILNLYGDGCGGEDCGSCGEYSFCSTI